MKFSKNSQLMAMQYIAMELHRAFPSISYNKWRSLTKNFSQKNSSIALFALLGGFSEGYRVNGVFRALSSDAYTWKLQKIPLYSVILTPMSYAIDRYTIVRSKRDPKKFSSLWHNDAKVRKVLWSMGVGKPWIGVKQPIFVWREGEKFKVFDGMNRVLSALAQSQSEKKSIVAWVGQRTKGRSLLGKDKAYFLLTLAIRNQNSKTLSKALVPVIREAIAQHRNGKELMQYFFKRAKQQREAVVISLLSQVLKSSKRKI